MIFKIIKYNEISIFINNLFLKRNVKLDKYTINFFLIKIYEIINKKKNNRFLILNRNLNK